MSITSQFQSTLPVWGGTQLFRHGMQVHRHFNPPSPCGEGRRSTPPGVSARHFNPPSPCGEGLPHTLPEIPVLAISIHPPRVGRDLLYWYRCNAEKLFQSTLPVWGGTSRGGWVQKSRLDFNPPSPCGEGHSVSL